MKQRWLIPTMTVLLSPLLAVSGWLVWSGLSAGWGPAPLPTSLPTAPSDGPMAGPTTMVGEGPNGEPATISPATMEPNRLFIPSLDIYAPLEPHGLGSHQWDGEQRVALVVPSDPGTLTLYDGGGQPCGPLQGTVLIAGHVASGGVRGALWPLSRIGAGAAAYVSCNDGTVTVWKQVGGIILDDKDTQPQDVFAASGPRRLVVETCGGPVRPDGFYAQNVIVLFAPVG